MEGSRCLGDFWGCIEVAVRCFILPFSVVCFGLSFKSSMWVSHSLKLHLLVSCVLF